MKKLLSIILGLVACLVMVACEEEKPSTPSPTPPSSSTQTPTPEEEKPSNNGGGTVVTPIQPGGDYEVGGGYGK